MDAGFADRIAALVEERRSQIVLGLDPDPAALWPSAVEGADERDPTAVATAVARHCRAVIDAAGPACVAVKFQVACFERLGWPGWAALEALLEYTQESGSGLLRIGDAKRGDVPVTARAYAEAFYRHGSGPSGNLGGLGVDAMTANPLLGRDSLEPIVEGAVRAGAGCFVLVRTSNPGAAEIQDVPAPERPLHELFARMVDELGAASVGDCGLSAVGAVTGATQPQLLERLRELMPRAIFLLPGVGAQGGSVDDLAAAFEPHPAAGLVAASRSIVNAHVERGGDPAEAAAAAAGELRKAAWRVSHL